MSADSIRAFAAVAPGNAALAEICKLLDEIARLRSRDVRAVNPENIHLTLKFLGNDVDAALVPNIAAALDDAASASEPFTLTLGRVGVFRQRGDPRVIWLGLIGDLDRLRKLQSDIENTLEAIGLPRETRPFRPHFTLARIRSRRSSDRTDISDRADADMIDRLLSLPNIETPIEVDAVSLIRSTLRPTGALYTELHSSIIGYQRVMNIVG